MKIDKEKILLAQLPYWDPLIPPMGIACLQTFLRKYHYNVKIMDLNVEKQFKDWQQNYFEILKTYIPDNKRGNFLNIGQEVLRNHLMSYLNYKKETRYIELVQILIFKTFFHHVSVQQILDMNQLVTLFYQRLEAYFLTVLQKEKPAVLGLSVYSGTLPASLFVFKRAKEKFPHMMTVMGGGIFANQLAPDSPNFDYFLKNTPYIDKIIVGEGEILFLKLMRNELPEQQRVYTLKDIQGEILNLEKAETTDYSDLDTRQYPYLGAYVSRSCPFQCSFCSETIQWGKYRKKPVTQMKYELIKLNKKYKSQLFLMGDSLLNPVVDPLANELLKEDKAIYWDGYLRAGSQVCDISNTLMWRQAGFYRARLGVESGSQHVLDLMEKHLEVDQIRGSIASLANVGIKTTTYWVIGYPGETEADFQLTLDLIKELKNDIYEAECNPFHFFISGQVNSHKWKKNRVSLYPREAVEMLMTQTWVLQCEPSWEEIHRRVCRFVQHCKKLGIPNPYSLAEIYEADERWKKLKKNAAPSLLDFKKNDSYIDECKNRKKINIAGDNQHYDVDFGF